MAAFDNDHSMAPECEATYYEDLMQKKLLPEWGISLEMVPEKLSAFYERMESTVLISFAPKPCRANGNLVREYYANLGIIDFFRPNPMVMIKGKEVYFGVKRINGVYGLDNIDMNCYEDKNYAPGS